MHSPHNPAHPGEVLREWLPANMKVTQAAYELLASPQGAAAEHQADAAGRGASRGVSVSPGLGDG